MIKVNFFNIIYLIIFLFSVDNIYASDSSIYTSNKTTIENEAIAPKTETVFKQANSIDESTQAKEKPTEEIEDEEDEEEEPDCD